MDSVTIRCSTAASEFLKRYKREHQLASVDAAILHIQAALEKKDQGDSSSSGGEKEPRQAEPHMFSFAWFDDEPKAREYYSGLPDNAFKWLHQHLMPEVGQLQGGAAFCSYFLAFGAAAGRGVDATLPDEPHADKAFCSCKRRSVRRRKTTTLRVGVLLPWHWTTS